MIPGMILEGDEQSGTEGLRFRRVRDGAATALVRAEWADELAAALLRGEGCVETEAGGRGTLRGFAFGDGRAVLRKYRRGGFVGHFLQDAYLLDNRPLRELRIHGYAYESGLSVPEPLGVCWMRAGLLYRGAIATREVPGRTLAQALQAGEEAGDILREVGRVIRAMHDRGIYHADLQVHNVLLGPDEPCLLDFDNARRLERLSGVSRARNLLRLRRSFEKNGLPVEAFAAVLEGYGSLPPLWLDRLYRVKGAGSDVLSGRAFRRG